MITEQICEHYFSHLRAGDRAPYLLITGGFLDG